MAPEIVASLVGKEQKNIRIATHNDYNLEAGEKGKLPRIFRAIPDGLAHDIAVQQQA